MHDQEIDDVIFEVVKLIAVQYSVTETKARDAFSYSCTYVILADEKTGLYKENPLYIFSLFVKEHNDLMNQIEEESLRTQA